ncbi:MAG: hypothetical protein J5858_03930, partial [Lentisphaeria bacterium]|nr:hypothetical protein [Lentisphaeria bacterium]
MKQTLAASLILSLLMTGCLQNGKVESKPEAEQPKQETKQPKQETKQPKQEAKPAKQIVKKAVKKLPALPQIVGTTNKSALSYQPGEEMVYTFKMDFASIPPVKGFLKYVRRGDDGKTFSGQVPADQELVVKTSLDRPGFVNVDVSLVDEKGKMLMVEMPLPNGKTVKRRVQYFAGTAVHPEKLTDCGEPADFDAFWEKQKKRLAEVPFEGKVTTGLVKTVKNGKI